MYCLPFSGYTILVFVLAILDFALCVALSPAQIFFQHTRPIDPDYKSLEIFCSKSNISDSNGSNPATILAEFVVPLFRSDTSVTDTVVFSLISIVVVHGLASNPKTTYEMRIHSKDSSLVASTTKPMWLRDFLPEENLNARIMAFSHNTAWEANALSKSLQECGDDLLRALRRVRQKAEVENDSLGPSFRLHVQALTLLRRRAGLLSSSVTALGVLSLSK